MEPAPLDPSLPGVRMLQNWIREGLPVSIAILDQECIEGLLIWQDLSFSRSNVSDRLALF